MILGILNSMRYTKEYIREKIDAEIANKPNRRYICVILTTESVTHEYIISYDTHTQTVNGVVEKIGKHRKVLRSLSDILCN